jgi:hypothetical protein
VSNFLVKVGENGKKAKLFVDDSELVVGKDSFFEGKDLFSVHVLKEFLLVSRFDRTLCST